MKMRHVVTIFQISAVLFLGGVGLAVFTKRARIPELPPLEGGSFVPVERRMPDLRVTDDWIRPTSQRAGQEWVFDVFTPPIIYFDEGRAAFVLEPAVEREPVNQLELLEVRHDPYRLQYGGHVGNDSDLVVEIRDIRSGGWYRGRAGQHFPEAGFSIHAFSTFRRTVVEEDSNRSPLVEVDVRLVIDDLVSGERVELSRELKLSEEPSAILRTPDGVTHVLQAGAVVEGEGWECALLEVDSLQHTALVRTVIGPDQRQDLRLQAARAP